MPADSYYNFSAMAALTVHFCLYIGRTFVWLGGYWRLLSKGLNDAINWSSLDVNEKNLNFLLSVSWNHLPLQTPVLPWLRRLRWSAITTSSTQTSTWYGLDFHCFNMLNEETFILKFTLKPSFACSTTRWCSVNYGVITILIMSFLKGTVITDISV